MGGTPPSLPVLSRRLAYSTSFADLIAIRAFCEEAGIFVYEPTMSAHVSIAGVDQGYFVEVLAEDLERARDLLRDSEYEKFLYQD